LNKILSISFALFILLTGASSCSKDPAPAPDLGYNYFPDKVGMYVVYNVDSIVYNATAISYPVIKDTYKFQIKEKIESIFTDNEGRPTMRLERYVKQYNSAIPYSAMSWTLRDVWVQNKTLRNAEKVEENVRYVKLVFPVKKEQEWNGNAKNTEPEENYTYNFFDRERTIGGIHFDSVLQVDQRNELNLIEQKYYEEKYARNVGLIYKRVIDVESQYNPAWNLLPPSYLNDSLNAFYQNPILVRASSGFQYTYTITTYGIE
jgi:hypothetical protein